MNENKLAIVIPAYKIDFFETCINSITNQTCKKFNLYIGDDASGSDLQSVAYKYANNLNLIYNRFETNLGGRDLIAHWNRCIDLTQDEEWIWLFSDDDVMDKDCVASFYKYLEEYPQFDIFHFNLIRINQFGENLGEIVHFPEVITIEDLLIGRLQSSIQTTVVEYIFRKKRLVEENYFQNFDLAWGSDDATWLKIAKYSNIKSIGDSNVYWRYSQVNISTRGGSNLFLRKMNARVQFVKWLYQDFGINHLKIKKIYLKKQVQTWFERFLVADIGIISNANIKELTNAFYPLIGQKPFVIRFRYFALFLVKAFIKFKGQIKKLVKW
jgi:glycosyltransferase involved in cell wall biosynthesis